MENTRKTLETAAYWGTTPCVALRTTAGDSPPLYDYILTLKILKLMMWIIIFKVLEWNQMNKTVKKHNNNLVTQIGSLLRSRDYLETHTRKISPSDASFNR